MGRGEGEHGVRSEGSSEMADTLASGPGGSYVQNT